VAFAIAVPTTRVLAIVFTQGNLIAARLGFAPRNNKEKEPLI
jgi:hypothetical protein